MVSTVFLIAVFLTSTLHRTRNPSENLSEHDFFEGIRGDNAAKVGL